MLLWQNSQLKPLPNLRDGRVKEKKKKALSNLLTATLEGLKKKGKKALPHSLYPLGSRTPQPRRRLV